MRLLLAACFGVLVASAPPAGPADGTRDILMSAPSSAELRARLAAHAQAVASADRKDAGAAQYYRALSYARAGLRDSAIACYRIALDLRGSREDRIALVDELLLRRSPGDVPEAIGLLEPALHTPEAEGPTDADSYAARLGWARFLNGQPDSARQLLDPLMAGLSLDPRWRYRLARVLLEAGDPREAYPVLRPLIVASRHQDEELVAMLDSIGRRTSRATQLQQDLRRAFEARDAAERAAFQAVQGRRLRFAASDGEYVSLVSLKPPARVKPLVALVLMAPTDTIAEYGGLGTALRSAGFAVAVVEPRGSGGSATPNCPLPDTWGGREEILEACVARDLGEALDALAQSLKVDDRRYVAVGVGASAPIAVQAAERDRRIAALVLVNPHVSPVERGAMLDRLHRRQVPVYFQMGGEGFGERQLVDAYYHAGLMRRSRIADARRPGEGVLQFAADPAAGQRLASWLKEVVTAAPSPHATPPPTQRPK